MKNTILAFAGSALIVFSGVQFATAAERHHGTVHHRVYSEFRDSNAHGPLAHDSAAEREWSRYSGGYSDMAGH